MSEAVGDGPVIGAAEYADGHVRAHDLDAENPVDAVSASGPAGAPAAQEARQAEQAREARGVRDPRQARETPAESDEADQAPGPSPLGVETALTGNADVDAVLQRLAEADELPTQAHVAVYEKVHGSLRDLLTALDTQPSAAPGPPTPGPPTPGRPVPAPGHGPAAVPSRPSAWNRS